MFWCQMGVHELGLRRAILAEVDKYKERQDEIRLETKLRKLGESKVGCIGHSLTHLGPCMHESPIT